MGYPQQIKNKLKELLQEYKSEKEDAWHVINVLTGWNAYAMQGNTYKLRKKISRKLLQELNKSSPTVKT